MVTSTRSMSSCPLGLSLSTRTPSSANISFCLCSNTRLPACTRTSGACTIWVCLITHINLPLSLTILRYLGAAYPNATGHNDGADEAMPLEECGNMLIMTLSYTQHSNDLSIIEQYVRPRYLITELSGLPPFSRPISSINGLSTSLLRLSFLPTRSARMTSPALSRIRPTSPSRGPLVSLRWDRSTPSSATLSKLATTPYASLSIVSCFLLRPLYRTSLPPMPQKLSISRCPQAAII